jgi:hypothetical protein
VREIEAVLEVVIVVNNDGLKVNALVVEDQLIQAGAVGKAPCATVTESPSVS